MQWSLAWKKYIDVSSNTSLQFHILHNTVPSWSLRLRMAAAVNMFQELITEQLDSAPTSKAGLESRWLEAARAVDIQQRQMRDAVTAATVAAQAAARAVASMAGHMARPTTPVGDHGADRAGSGVAPQDKLTSDEYKSIIASTKGLRPLCRSC